MVWRRRPPAGPGRGSSADGSLAEREIFGRFSDPARRVLLLAQEEARLLDHNFIGTEHLLLGLIHEGQGGGMAVKALQALGISEEDVRAKVAEWIGPSGPSPATPDFPFTPRTKKVLELSLREAFQLGHNYISTEHLLLGLIREGEGVGAQVLIILGADLSRVREEVSRLLGRSCDRLPAQRSPVAARRQTLVPPGPGVSAVPVPFDPTLLLAWEDVEEVLRGAAELGRASVMAWEADGLAHRSYEFAPRPLPLVTVSVAGAEVGSEAFEQLIADRAYERIEGLGDAAAYDDSTSTLRVRKGSVVFAIAVHGHSDPRAAATALATKAGHRLD